MKKVFNQIFIILCLIFAPNLSAQAQVDCPNFLEQPDTTGDPNCGFFDGVGNWVNLCSPCGKNCR